MEVHNKIKKYVQNWISVMIWYLEIQTVIEMSWWRIVLRKCRRRTGLINCGAQLGPVDLLLPNLNNLLLRKVFNKFGRIFLPILCGPGSFGMIDLGLKKCHNGWI